MIHDYSIIISSCDKFSDLWEMHFKLLLEHWKGKKPDIFLITDKPTLRQYDGVEILVFDGDMPTRLCKACEVIDNKYVLITLDDYFLISDVYGSNIERLIKLVEKNQIDYLRIYDRRYAKKKHYKSIDCLEKIDLSQKYALSLYPAIWNKHFFAKCVDKDVSPWAFEPELTEKAIKYNARCFSNNSGVFEILDVVRKGKVLHKANRYFIKNKIDIGERPVIEWRYEIKQSIADFIWWYMPRWVYSLTRRIAERCGMKFYSKK